MMSRSQGQKVDLPPGLRFTGHAPFVCAGNRANAGEPCQESCQFVDATSSSRNLENATGTSHLRKCLGQYCSVSAVAVHGIGSFTANPFTSSAFSLVTKLHLVTGWYL